jgi:hypothetical protein
LNSIDENGYQTIMGRGQRSKDPKHMRALALAAAGPSDNEGSSHRVKRKSVRKLKPVISSGNSFDPLEVETASDANDDNFVAEEPSSTKSFEADSDIQELTNAEV